MLVGRWACLVAVIAQQNIVGLMSSAQPAVNPSYPTHQTQKLLAHDDVYLSHSPAGLDQV